MPKFSEEPDPFFRTGLYNPTIAKAFIKRYLPAELQKSTDLKGLAIVETEGFLYERLSCDDQIVLFSVPIIGSKDLFYLLMIHQSQPGHLMKFGLGRFRDAISDLPRDLSVDHQLPLFYSFILYTGEHTVAAVDPMTALFEGFYPPMDGCLSGVYQIIDLTLTPNEELKGSNLLRVYMMLLKHVRSPNLTTTLMDMAPVLTQIEKEAQGARFLVQALHYLVYSCEVNDLHRFFDVLCQHVSKPTEEDIRAMIHQFHKRIMSKNLEAGLEYGRQKAKREIALKLLESEIEEVLIIKSTELSIREVRVLQHSMES